MKATLCLLLVLVLNSGFSQQKTVNFSVIDRNARFTDANTVDELTTRLTSPYKTDLEKVRAIFIWIIEHITYNTCLFSKVKKKCLYAGKL